LFQLMCCNVLFSTARVAGAGAGDRGGTAAAAAADAADLAAALLYFAAPRYCRSQLQLCVAACCMQLASRTERRKAVELTIAVHRSLLLIVVGCIAAS